MPFLTFYTPTYKRPRLLADCHTSIQMQSDSDWEHVVIPDLVGIGINGVFREVKNNASKINGQYVYFLQDDDVIADEDMVRDIKKFAIANNYPPVIIARNIKGALNLPLNWHSEPLKGTIDLGSYIVRADVFKLHADQFGERYEGDFDFIHYLWDAGYEFAWWDKLIAIAQQWGYGMPEREVTTA